MSEYMFGCGKGSVSDREATRVNRIAKKHGAWFTRVDLPGDGPKFWFSCRNEGAPFDGQTERAVLADVGQVKARR